MSSSPDAINVSLLHRLVSYIAVFFLHVVGKTSFFRRAAHPSANLLISHIRKKPFIWGFWHNQQVILAYDHRGDQTSNVVSQSKDGEYIAQVMLRLKEIPIRGSTTRGGTQALRKCLSTLKKGWPVGFTPDGPKGPLGTVHPGVIAAAKISGAPIIPLGAALTRKKVFNSWDKFEIPLPFGVVSLTDGQPFKIPSDLPEEEAAALVRKNLDEVRRQAEKNLEVMPGWLGLFFAECVFRIYQLLWMVFFPFILAAGGLAFGLRRGLLGLGQRFGKGVIPGKKLRRLWIHAASVGEWRAAKPLVHLFKDDPSWEIFMTTTTPEGRAVAEKESGGPVRLLPFDAPFIMASFVRKVKADAIVVIETEIWPGLIRAAAKNRNPLFLANGRLSEKSSRRWKAASFLAKDLLNSFTAIFTRGTEDAARFEKAGADSSRVSATGNLKIDNLPALNDSSRKPLFAGNAPVLLGGSTWPGEEAWLLEFWKKQKMSFSLILAPRRLERVSEVTAELKKNNAPFSLWSEARGGLLDEGTILVLDVMGELAGLYASSDVVFVGGSIFKKGGQNPLEPAAAGKPIIFGPSMENFREEARGLSETGGAFWARSQEEAEEGVRGFLHSPEKRFAAGEKAKAFVNGNRGSAKTTFEKIKSFYPTE